MSHISIAIIRKKNQDSDEHVQYSYLVQSLGSGVHQFLNVVESAIGGGFDFSKIRRYVLKYLELSKNTIELDKILSNEYYDLTDFLNVDVRETNRHSPYATPCVITLSEMQIQAIEKSMRDSDDEKWKSLNWITEKDLAKHKNKWKEEQKFIFKKEDSFKIPPFPNELRVSLRNIVKARNSGKLVIFAGAGVSVDSLVPMWNELTEELKGDLDGKALNTEDSLELAQLYFDSRGTKEYQERVREILKYRQTKFNPIHQKVVQILPCHIITTNFDEHFEQVLKNENSVYSIIKKDSDLPYSTGNSLFIKMHGDFSERNIVLTANDFKSYSEDFPLISGAINGIFASKLVLFIGYSFNDPNLKEIYRATKNILGENIQPPYFVTTSINNSARKKLEDEYKFKILELNSKSKNAINSYFSQVASDDEETKMNLLSEKGQDLYKLLSVIDKFDLILTTFDGKSIEKQLISSLSRFSKFGAIPGQVIEQITPFKIKGKISNKISTHSEIRSDRNFHLKTPNEELLKFLKKEKGQKSRIDYYTFKSKDRTFREQEMDKVWRLLFSSGVRCIIRKNDTSPEHFKLHPINISDVTEENCNCSKCRFDRFEWANLLLDLSSSSNKLICKNNFFSLNLDLAYGYMKTGQVVQAYYTLEEAKNQSIKQNDYVTHYLACYNQKILKGFLWYSNSRFTEESEFEKISEQIDSIDLDKILYELPIDKDVQMALRIIRDDSLFDDAKRIIDENVEEILKIYAAYEKGGYRHSGPYYWQIIEFEFFSLWNFYHKNRMFNDSLSIFHQLAETFIEGMLASLATSDDYRGKVEKLNGFFISMFILYSRPKTNLELLKKYRIKRIELDKKLLPKKDFLKSFDSFITSGYKENDFFGRTININEQYSNAIGVSEIFSVLNGRALDNFLLLLSYLDLSNIEINDCVEKVLNYISVNEKYSIGYGSLNALTHFATKRVVEITTDNLERTIEILLNKERFTGEIEEICNAVVNTKKAESFLSHKTYKKLKHGYLTLRRDVYRFDLVSLYPLLLKEDQLDFFTLIADEIRAEPESKDRLIVKAYYWGLWNPKKNPLIFEAFTNLVINSAKNFPDYELRDDGLPVNINDFTVWNRLINLTDMVYMFDLLQHDAVKKIREVVDSKMFKWILAPDAYNYSKFDGKWLVNFSNKPFFEVLRKSEKFMIALENHLKIDFNANAAKAYFKMKSTNEVIEKTKLN